MKTLFNIMVAGVGGQGNLVCGRALALAAMEQGLRPVLGDTFGASRRGGSVITHLRIAERDLGPLIPKGKLDIILGMEPIETLRAAFRFGGPHTLAIFNTHPIQSPSTLSGEAIYPNIEEIIDALKELCFEIYPLDTSKVVEKAGTNRVLNVYMLGALMGLGVTPLEREKVESSIETLVELDEKNQNAFDSGVHDGQSLANK